MRLGVRSVFGMRPFRPREMPRPRGLRPETVTDLLQIVKSVLAAGFAWWLAAEVLHSTMPFLAPWVALLTVYPTVFESFRRGAQSTVASWLGVALSFVVGAALGTSVWTLAIALLVALALARIRWIREEGIAIATTVIFVLGAGSAGDVGLLTDRILEVALGALVGIVVNLLLIPPLRDRQAARYVDSVNRRMGEVLISMADEFRTSWETDRAQEWLEETESMSSDLASAWSTVRTAHESRRANPRNRLRSQRSPEDGAVPPEDRSGYEQILARIDEGVSHLRHMARTLREASGAERPWDQKFREEWADLVGDTGQSVADPDADVAPILDRIDALADALTGREGLRSTSWPLYGSLLTSLRHIVVVVDDVATAREAREAGRSRTGAEE